MIEIKYYNPKRDKWFSAKFETTRGCSIFIKELKERDIDFEFKEE